MSPALFGILQLDRGEPNGLAQIPGLVQAWLQDAGGFAMVGLVIYLIYALATPTDKSESEKLRVPVSSWMLWMAALAILVYALFFATFLIQKPTVTLGGKTIPIAAPEPPPPDPANPVITPPPTVHTELRPVLFTMGGLLAILGLGQPFARDLFKILGRNLSFGLSGVRRFGRSLANYTSGLVTTNRLIVLGAVLAAYAALGVALYAFGTPRLFGIWLGVCLVAATVFVLGLLILMLFEAEGPVWAIAKLSFKEAVRSQLLWVFLLVFLPFLFPTQWFQQIKPADELRTTVGNVYLFLTFLVLFPAVLLAAFGIPNDIRNLNIYTVVSKPVERFEIVLGRFVGYVSLMTLVLIGLTGVSLVLIMNSTIAEKAREETYKARVPVRGKLEFKSLQAQFRTEKQEFTGTNVGREFDYRKYIAGHPNSPQRAIWHYPALPADLGTAEGDRIPVEFTFDIFKLTKGEQNKGANVSFRFVTHNAPQEQPVAVGEWPWRDRQAEAVYAAVVSGFRQGKLIDRTLAERLDRGAVEARLASLAGRLKAAGVEVRDEGGERALYRVNDAGEAAPFAVNPDGIRPGGPDWKVANALAEEFGVFEVRNKEVFDYTVMGVDIPAGLVRNALAGDPGKDAAGNPVPRLSVYVKCETPGQLLGVAEPDLYLLEYERPFAVNFLKGMVGLWCWLCILVGLAVACSTYLSGVLSLLAACAIFAVGFFSDHVNDLAANRVVGGGPFESISRLVKAEQPTAPTAETAGAKVLVAADKGTAWAFRRIQNVIPDVKSLWWSDFVAEGFNISGQYLVVNILVTFGYLLPWAIFAYYMMKLREVAA